MLTRTARPFAERGYSPLERAQCSCESVGMAALSFAVIPTNVGTRSVASFRRKPDPLQASGDITLFRA